MTASVYEGDAIVAGYEWRLSIEASDLAFPEGVAIVGHVRNKVADAAALLTLSTASGTIERASSTRIDIIIDGDASKNWKAGVVVMDFVRTDTDPDQYLGFVIEVPVVLPVTRGLA